MMLMCERLRLVEVFADQHIEDSRHSVSVEDSANITKNVGKIRGSQP
jgi:hypothetical protein